MLDDRKLDVLSIEELISRLEHVDENELQSDIRANVCAELRRIKRNLTAVLSFFEHSRLPENPDLRQAASDVRRECIQLNAMISRILVLFYFRIGQRFCMAATSKAFDRYRGMAEAACQICQSLAPAYTVSMAGAM
jgi:Zn-dependent oligopeptidase